ncbi:helix-turn-helix domain-containing protein [Pandoraea fibrosis]|uniref:Helix-hairpin-helix DNA-binding motif-containing protein n=1 Tax=Pandoraea fibrosis TaxID=1891094 RepID=A0A5E4U5G8_9BURK|nr:helix-turn-helix domain-containing protein [Pandoraea fibrosis]VVD94843.1 helix-hairpin-helix DNA-binding motif-containing protein [Pandoraea fibrosis]
MQTNPLALFGDHLARLRKARGWSQEKLALESGLARSYVSGIERGRRNVALVNICVLADTLGVPTSEMLRFAQAAPGAQDTSAPSDRTPLPQISRSLCRLENRDQVWLAEIIRSLSSRLSHAAPPGSTHAVTQTSAVSRAGHNDRIEKEDDEDPDAFPDAVDAERANDARVPRPPLGNVPASAQFAASMETVYRVDDDADRPADTRMHIREPAHTSSDDAPPSPDPATTHRSDAIAREDSRRFPNDDEA